VNQLARIRLAAFAWRGTRALRSRHVDGPWGKVDQRPVRPLWLPPARLSADRSRGLRAAATSQDSCEQRLHELCTTPGGVSLMRALGGRSSAGLGSRARHVPSGSPMNSSKQDRSVRQHCGAGLVSTRDDAHHCRLAQAHPNSEYRLSPGESLPARGPAAGHGPGGPGFLDLRIPM